MYSVLEFLTKLRRDRLAFLTSILALFTCLVYSQLFITGGYSGKLRAHFLSVGQGDSTFVEFPGGVQMLVDGGPPGNRILTELSRFMEPTDRYIDLLVLSHPQLDHFGGFLDVLKHYRIGAFVWNGYQGETANAFHELLNTVSKYNIPNIIVKVGDKILYTESSVTIHSPKLIVQPVRDVNNTSLVFTVKNNNVSILFTGDIDGKLDASLADSIGDIDILKVAHHGSKFSSSANFLKSITPLIAVIGVGKNSYGHPTTDTLQRLASIRAHTFRTDLDGTITIEVENGNAKIFSYFSVE